MDYAAIMRTAVPGTFVPDMGAMSEKPIVGPIPGGEAGATDQSGATSFRDTVKQILSDVNDKITTSDTNMQDLATGKSNDLEKTVTSVEEANLALQYTMAVRTKLLDAYTQISSMQL